MIEDVVSGWLYARSTNLTDLVRADLTLVLPTKSGLRVYAEMMITSFSQGGDLDKHVGGSVATRVVRATMIGKSGIEYIDLPADLTNNSAFFDNCLAVDFRLGCLLAEAYANANVWHYSKPAKKPTVLIRKDIGDQRPQDGCVALLEELRRTRQTPAERCDGLSPRARTGRGAARHAYVGTGR